MTTDKLNLYAQVKRLPLLLVDYHGDPRLGRTPKLGRRAPGAPTPITGGRGLKIVRFKRISSTNTTAKALAEKGAAEWTVVVSEVQTRGRGRSGRTWESPKGGLWFSIIIKPRIPADRISLLQFLFASALRKGVDEVCGVQSEVKWPNDLVVDWKKLAGILIQTKISGPELAYAVVGVGLNVNLSTEELPTEATSIFLATKQLFSLEKTLSSILTVMERQYGTLGDVEAVVGDWWNHCAHRMKQVKIETDNGPVRGRCVGVKQDGSINIQTETGNVTVSDGTLRLDA